MTTESTVDRQKIRSMVEDFWRSFLATAQSSPETSAGTIKQFEYQMEALASMMPPSQSQAFRKVVEEERDALFEEYRNSPDALKTRLGLLEAPPRSEEIIAAHDNARIVGAMQRDYADLQAIARGKGSISELGEKVDRELERKLRSYVASMSMEHAAEFQRVYIGEYNRLVRARLTGGQGGTGCAVVILAGLGIAGAIGCVSHMLA